MNYLSVENISKSYGERTLFEELSFGINKDQKVAFVAKNGTGKTSILNILAGKDTPDTGQVIQRKGIHIAYLSQEESFDPSLNIEETIFATENKILPIIKQYETALRNPNDSEAYQKAFELMEQHNAWDFETQYRLILSKLKLNDLTQKVGSLSGGQRKRLSLAIILINKPDLLILDEPTNHLDIESIMWLEQFLKNYTGAVVIVSHDKMFLDNVTNRTIEIVLGQIYDMPKPYTKYLKLRAEQKALQIAAQKNQQKQIEQTEKLIENMMKPQITHCFWIENKAYVFFAFMKKYFKYVNH